VRRHELKVWPEFFQDLYDDRKRVELRKDDRGFEVGDILLLREWDPNTGEYTGSFCTRKVTHILRGGPWLADGYCAMSIRDVTGKDLRAYDDSVSG